MLLYISSTKNEILNNKLTICIVCITSYYFRFRLTTDQITYGLPLMDVRNTPLGNKCPLEVDFPCQPRKYRAFSGYCNNVQNPHWGNANTRYLRFLPAEYTDGISSPRGGGIGGTASKLPSPREVSLTVHRDEDLPHPHLMAITAVWGEFIAHDMAHTPQMRGISEYISINSWISTCLCVGGTKLIGVLII